MGWRGKSEPCYCRLNERKKKHQLYFTFQEFFLISCQKTYIRKRSSQKIIISTRKCYNDQYFKLSYTLNYETDNYRGEIIDKG